MRVNHKDGVYVFYTSCQRALEVHLLTRCIDSFYDDGANIYVVTTAGQHYQIDEKELIELLIIIAAETKRSKNGIVG